MLHERIPVTIIGGFLGAGKTTLVNHLLASGVRRFGVIVNEFGRLGVDGALIEALDAPNEGVTELANGCLCCFGRDDLVEALVKLALRDIPPEHILIELSGVADPVPVAQTVLDPYVKALFELNAIVGVADARNLWATVQETPEGAVQLAYASTVVLNKCDLAAGEMRNKAHELAQQLNPLAEVLRASHARVDPETLLRSQFTPRWDSAQPPQTAHLPGLKSIVLESKLPLERGALNRFIESHILSKPDQVYRSKGFVSLAGSEQLVLVQAVRDILSLTLLPEAAEGRSQLVVIGRDLDAAALERAFAETQKRPGTVTGTVKRRFLQRR